MRFDEIKEAESDYEIKNLQKLDGIMVELCRLVIDNQKEDSEQFGMVAAAVLDPDNNVVASTSTQEEDGKMRHAERNAIDAYQAEFGEIPEGSIILTTLSPCSEHQDETAEERYGESCTELINNSPVHKVYCGYMDPSQGDDQHDERSFTLQETNNQQIRDLCKQFADTFLDLEADEEEIAEDWQKVNRRDKTAGMSRKAVKAYRRENPGSKLQTAVTTKPSKLKPGSKAAKRRKSFCARMKGNKGPMKKPNGKPTNKALALRRWNCE